jgi:hypothetical protein
MGWRAGLQKWGGVVAGSVDGEGVSEGGSLVVVSKSDNERVEKECGVDGSVAFET